MASADSILRAHFERVAERDHVPGIAYGLVLDGRLAHSGGVGSIGTGADATPTAETRSRIASMTKSFTAAGVLMLRDEGTLALDDRVETYVPELAALTPSTTDSPRITVRHLLSMASGLPEDNAWADRHLQVSRSDVDAMFSAGATFARAPGVAYEYSNLGWVMLGRVIEAVAGRPAQTFLSERILEPLHLTNTTWDPPEGDVMVGYRRRDDTWLQESEPLPDGGFGPIGGLWSTVTDVAAWMAFLMDAFPPRDDPDPGPVRRASRREMQQVQRADTSSHDADTNRLSAGGYGFGLVVKHDLRFGTIVSHAGGLPGFASQMMWLPQRRAGLAVLMNLTGVHTDVAALEVLELLDDEGLIPAAAALPIAPQLQDACDGVMRLLNAWDDELADALFAGNVDLDEPRERRRDEAAKLLGAHGPLAVESIVAKSATTATITAHGQGEPIQIEVELSPEVPSRLQRYEVKIA